jgi:hypothetical protein
MRKIIFPVICNSFEPYLSHTYAGSNILRYSDIDIWIYEDWKEVDSKKKEVYSPYSSGSSSAV